MLELLILGIMLLIFAMVIWRVMSTKSPPIKELNGKKLLYADSGGGKPFFSREYHIQSKPDLIYRLNKESDAVVEYKHREKCIYPSDEVQLLATVIAARSKYPNINVGYISLADGTFQKYELPEPTSVLAERISLELRSARLATAKFNEPVTPDPAKCNACSVRYACNYAGVEA
ncbi:MAG: hypothetical protein AMJ53_10985 [Gammaproteobacteria bacterium SG8_11]|nr:MAG: hypothetical protein AMJ53_10985 [Gammaproteobacteria bacterium SG8_11]